MSHGVWVHNIPLPLILQVTCIPNDTKLYPMNRSPVHCTGHRLVWDKWRIWAMQSLLETTSYRLRCDDSPIRSHFLTLFLPHLSSHNAPYSTPSTYISIIWFSPLTRKLPTFQRFNLHRFLFLTNSTYLVIIENKQIWHWHIFLHNLQGYGDMFEVWTNCDIELTICWWYGSLQTY